MCVPKQQKVRKTRRFVVKDWEYFDELQKLTYPVYKLANTGSKDAKPFGQTFVFSVDGSTLLSNRALEYHFARMLKNVQIGDGEKRVVVPYSFRHYFITDMINRGATLMQVAETCGTSAQQIQHTYYHMTETKMISNTLPQFEYKNGLLYPK